MYTSSYLQEIQIRAQLKANNVYKNRGPMRIYYGFRVKRVVSMSLTNCFCKKNFMFLLNFAFICYLFCPIFKHTNLLSQAKDPVFLRVINEP